MKVIQVLEEVNEKNVKSLIMSDFDNEGNSTETTADKISWEKFAEWIRMKDKRVFLGNDTLENRMRLLIHLINIGKIIYWGKVFKI